jgi:BirA family biotin operon repressor/biotin-[acetyl-CoA-carboxylase] ligase
MLRTVPGTTDRRIDALLALLADNSLIAISGSKIASEIGVTRSTVWRWIERLRSLGVNVKGHAGAGYQLEKFPDVLAPQLLRRRLAGTMFGKRIHHFFKADSTNAIAMRLGHDDEPHGALVLAEEQTSGRGRAGRAWHSEKSSGIYVTALLRPPVAPPHAPLLTLLAGLAARDAVEEQCGLPADIRWPNDLLLSGRKFCGILTEMHAEPDRVRFAVIGLGLNVNHAQMPEALRGIATSLRLETGRTHSRLDLLLKLLRHLDRYYNRFLAEGGAPLVARFAEVSSYARGKRVRVTAPGCTYSGVTDGLEPGGMLRVRRDDTGGTEVVISGDVAELEARRVSS